MKRYCMCYGMRTNANHYEKINDLYFAGEHNINIKSRREYNNEFNEFIEICRRPNDHREVISPSFLIRLIRCWDSRIIVLKGKMNIGRMINSKSLMMILGVMSCLVNIVGCTSNNDNPIRIRNIVKTVTY